MDCVTNLDDAIIDLMQTQIILADKCVKKVLVALSKSDDYCLTLKECAKGFDYDREYIRYFSTEHKKPESKRMLVALISHTLYKIDSGKINFLDFLKTLYPEKDTTESYPKFIEEYIIPFVDALNFLTFGQPYDDVKQPQINSYDKLREEITWAVGRIIKELLPDNGLDNNDELYVMLNGLIHSVSLCDNIIIKVAYIGLENTVFKYNIDWDDELANLKNILIIYGVL